MGALIGLMFGLGALLVWRSGTRAPQRKARPRPATSERIGTLLTEAGFGSVRPAHLVAASAAAALVTLVAATGMSGSPTIGLAFAVFAAYAPTGFVRHRGHSRAKDRRELWPEVVDNIASAVRAGLSLPEALAEVGVRGPTGLRRPFQRFAVDYRATGRFSECLDPLKATLADPVGDRIVESLRVARDVGGTDLGRLLLTLAAFLREDARTRAELETRQGWTVNAARLALAAPWVMLALLAFNPDAAEAYNSTAGAVVLLVGGALSFGAYRIMLRIARLPAERRVLR